MCQIADISIGIGLMAAGYLDLRKRALPVWLLCALNVTSIVLCILIRRNTFSGVVGGAFVGAFFFLVSKVTRESIGYGDSWLILILGIYLGVRAMIRVIFMASFFASLISLALCLKNGWNKKKSLPFVPFLVLAYGLEVFL